MSSHGSIPDFAFAETSSVLSLESPSPPHRPIMDAYSKRVGVKRSLDRATAEGVAGDIQAPQIVVIGSQSAGKSSLFEGISRIPLPKNHGTCTRCPIICHMQNKNRPWSCRIGILREGKGKSDSNSLHQYIQFGEIIYSHDQVRDRISRAQAAILQPSQDLQQFLDPSFMQERIDGFSFDSIVVDIDGPDVIDLSFVDLPGIIASGPHVDDVQKMAEKFISKPCNIILLVLNCADDKENQGAVDIAHKYDQDGTRTITVLTKPDKHDIGDEARTWQDFLRESPNRFCVKQPGPKDQRNMSWEEARKQEMDWFHNNWWADVANDPDTCRQVGTENLTNYLNSELLNRLVARLPAIQEDLRKKLRILRGDLDNLPPPIEDPIKQTNQLIWKFGDAIKAAISHDNFKIPVLVGECRRELEKYTNVLVYHLFPRFCPVQSQSASTFRFDDMDDFPTALPKPPKVSAESAKPRVVYLDEIIQKCEVGRTLEMPGNSPYGVRKEFMEIAVNAWQTEVEKVLDDVFDRISRIFDAVLTDKFGNIGGLNIMLATVQTHLENRRNAVRQVLLASLKMEKRCSMIYGCSEYFHLKDIYYQHYLSLRSGGNGKKARTKKSLRAGDAIHMAANVIPNPGIQAAAHIVGGAINALDGSDEEDAVEDDISPEEKHAIDVMAETRAFYHMAVRRYAEGTCQIIFHDLLLDIQGESELQESLRTAIGVSNAFASPGEDGEVLKRCQAFMEPSPEVIERRKTLHRRRETLQSVLSELMGFNVARDRKSVV